MSTEGEPGSKDRWQSLATRPTATGNQRETRMGGRVKKQERHLGVYVCDAEQVVDSHMGMLKIILHEPIRDKETQGISVKGSPKSTVNQRVGSFTTHRLAHRSKKCRCRI